MCILKSPKGWIIYYLVETRGVRHPGRITVYCSEPHEQPVTQGDLVVFPNFKIELPGNVTGYERCN